RPAPAARALRGCAILGPPSAASRGPPWTCTPRSSRCSSSPLLAPLVSGLMPVRSRVPQVVVLLLGGIVIGPSMLHLASPDDVALLSDLGMGFLFLLAGYELEP